MPKKTPPDTIETIRRLHLDQGLSGVAIAKQLNLPVSTVNYILKKLGRKVMKPVKQATEAQIKEQKAIEEIQGEVKGSIQQRKWLMDKLKDIIESPTKKFTMHGTRLDEKTQKQVTFTEEREIDDRGLRVKAISVYNELRNSFDEMLGIVDVAVRKKLEEHDEEIKRLKRDFGKA